MTAWSSSLHSTSYLPEPLFAPLDHNNIRIFFPMLQHCLPSSGSRGSVTLPHRLPLRSIPPPRFACGSSHSRGHGRPRSVRKSSRLRGKCLFTELLLLRHSKSVGPSAPIAYATSVSPPDEAIAWPGCRCWVQDEAVASQGAGVGWQMMLLVVRGRVPANHRAHFKNVNYL